MALEQALLKILVCPVDKGSLLYFDDERLLYNPRLRRRYEVAGDVPVLLADEADTVSEAEHSRLLRRAGTGAAVPTRRSGGGRREVPGLDVADAQQLAGGSAAGRASR